MAAKEDARTITILIINHKDWTPQQLPLTNLDIYIIATIPPHTIQSNPTPKWPKYYQYIELSFTSITCVHNQTNLPKNVQTPIELQQVRKQTTNTHIGIHPIKPTPIHYNVKFSTARKNSPKISTTVSLIMCPYFKLTLGISKSKILHLFRVSYKDIKNQSSKVWI